MAGLVRRRETPDKRLVLGFDAGCMTCSELARRIEEQVGDKLEIRSLRDPQVEEWRRRALGDEAPWAPTLIEVRGPQVRAWTGRGMAVHMGRSLGPVATWRVLQVLGELGAASEAEESTVARTIVGLSRGQFLKGVAGAAVAMAIVPGAVGLSSSVSAAKTKSGAPGELATTFSDGSKAKVDRLSNSETSDSFNKMISGDNDARKLHEALEKEGFKADDKNGTGGNMVVSPPTDKRATLLLIPYGEAGHSKRKATLWLYESGNTVRGDFTVVDEGKDEAEIYAVKGGDVKRVKKIEHFKAFQRRIRSGKSTSHRHKGGSKTASTQTSSSTQMIASSQQYGGGGGCVFTNQVGECETECDLCRKVASLGASLGVGDFFGSIAAATICAAATGGFCAFAVGFVVGAAFLAGVTFTGADLKECQQLGFC